MSLFSISLIYTCCVDLSDAGASISKTNTLKFGLRIGSDSIIFFIAALSRMEYFEEVQAPVDWATRVSEWKFRMVFWPVCLSLLLLVTLSLIICNSVRLSLLSRKLLVENMKYAGGSPFFIEFPFVLEGMMQGLVGSGLAVSLLLVVIESIGRAIPLVGENIGGLWVLLGLVVCLVTLVSAYFSYRTVQEFLLAKRSERE